MPRTTATANSPLLQLDVRLLLEQGHDPLLDILHMLDRLTPDGLLVLTTPFRPDPLITLLEERGYRLNPVELDPNHWQVEILPSAAPEITDYRDLPAPEPLEKILTEVAQLPIDGVLLARVPHVPGLLFPMLEKHKLAWSVLEESDGSAIIHIHKKEDAG
ncbi:MAG TPA: DUF2249 domain-containing protein [Arenicellales bacterium]|nr:DUF2249 domain-containing protein [Arenicellales bacterium]